MFALACIHAVQPWLIPTHTTVHSPLLLPCALQVSMHAMQRSPDLWPQPLAFLPERFVAGSPEAEQVRGAEDMAN